jgi:tryptophan 5-monooxygenase
MVWDRLYPLLQKHACAEYLTLLPELQKHCGFRRDNIPQMQVCM